MPENTEYIYAPIEKVDKATREIQGPISGPNNPDLDQQIVDVDWLRRAVGPWMTFGNVREQHRVDRPVGKAMQADLNTPDGVPYIRAKIVDDDAWKKVEAGIYSGFSVGIKNARIVSDDIAKRGRIIDGDLVEVSIVDHPANPKAQFAICKGAGLGRWIDEQSGIEFSATQAPTESGQAAVLPSANVPETPSGNPFAIPVDQLKAMSEALDKSAVPDEAKGQGNLNHMIQDAEHTSTDEHFSNYPSTVRHDGKTHAVENHTHYHGAISHAHPHIHPNGRPDHFRFGPNANHDDHAHCAHCGMDDRVCNHPMDKDPSEKNVMPDDNKGTAATTTANENNIPGASPSEEETRLAQQRASDAQGASTETEHNTSTNNNKEIPNDQNPPNQDDVNPQGDNKGVTPDVQKDKVGLPSLATPRGGTATVPRTSPLTDQHRSIEDLLSDISNKVNALAREVGGKKNGELPINDAGASKTDAEFQNEHKMPPSDWHGKDMFDVKAAVKEAIDELLPAALAKAIGASDDLLTKGVQPDTVKQLLDGVAESAVTKAVEPLREELDAIKEVAAPLVGVAHSAAVDKVFSRNPNVNPTVDDYVKMARDLPDDESRMEIAKAAIAAQYRQPSAQGLFTPMGYQSPVAPDQGK